MQLCICLSPPIVSLFELLTGFFIVQDCHRAWREVLGVSVKGHSVHTVANQSHNWFFSEHDPGEEPS